MPGVEQRKTNSSRILGLQGTFQVLKPDNMSYNIEEKHKYSMRKIRAPEGELADTIKQLREERGFLQKQVAAEIGLKPAHYNKLEKGMVEPSVEILDKLASLYGITIDQIVHPENNLPQEVTIENKGLLEQVKLIQELEEKDRNTVFNIIDTMLTKAKFKDFFNKNIAAL